MFCSSASYAIARTRTKFSNYVYVIFLIGLMIPDGLIMIPTYQVLRGLHIINTHIGLISLYIGARTAFVIFLYTGFIKAVPKELDEAAIVDVCSVFMIFWRIIFPLLKPVTATVVIMNALPVFNDFLYPLLYLSKHPTVTLALYNFRGEHTLELNLLFAGVTIAMIPPIIVFLLFQKHFISGLTAGAVKG